jgi:hypothetical protein
MRSETKPIAVTIAAAHFYNLPESEIDRSGATTGQRKYKGIRSQQGPDNDGWVFIVTLSASLPSAAVQQVALDTDDL